MDKLGRVVVPKELRKERGMTENDSFEIFVDGDLIILRKYQPGCTFCSGLKNLREFGGHQICEDCRTEIKQALRLTSDEK